MIQVYVIDHNDRTSILYDPGVYFLYKQIYFLLNLWPCFYYGKAESLNMPSAVVIVSGYFEQVFVDESRDDFY